MLEEQVSQMRVQVEESRGWQMRARSEKEGMGAELQRAREEAAARAAEVELMRAQVGAA